MMSRCVPLARFARLIYYPQSLKSLKLANIQQVFAVLILIISTGVGATFSLMLARFNSSIDAARAFSRPIFTPVWSLVGFFNEIDLPTQTGAENPTRVLMPLLLFLYLVAVVVLVNLLIAAMAETYQRVKESSTLYWLFERAQLIQEFKRKGALPPPLNIFTLFLHDVPRCMRDVLRRCGLGRIAVYLEFMQVGEAHVREGFVMVPGPAQLRRFQRRMQIALKKSLRRGGSAQQADLGFQVCPGSCCAPVEAQGVVACTERGGTDCKPITVCTMARP